MAKTVKDVTHVSDSYTDWINTRNVNPGETYKLNDKNNKGKSTIRGIPSDVYNLLITNLKGVYGIPYQFMPSVDRRVNIAKKDTSMGSVDIVGRKYAEKIISRIPILFLTPGNPGFMDGFNKTDKGIIWEALEQKLKDNTIEGLSDIESLLSKSGKFYSFKFAYAEYFKYVNTLLNATARLLGLQDTKIPNADGDLVKIGRIDWSTMLSDTYKGHFSAKESIPFYIDSENSISEDFSNDTTESSLASSVNNYSSETRELAYIAGGITGADTSGVQEGLSNIINGLNGFRIGSTIGDGLETIVTGGKLIFPKMWSDSDFSRSYTINLKLRSPDHDTLSIFLNILVPWMHLVAMAAPHESPNSVNGLNAPFLVRGFYKGFFNCDMGIIRSLSATKGAEGQWNVDGLPTTMDVSINLEDLYSNMSISNAFGDDNGLFKGTIDQDSIKKFIKNTSLVDYLCMNAGINLNQPEIERMAGVYCTLAEAKLKGYPERIFTQWEQNISNLVGYLYRTLGVK